MSTSTSTIRARVASGDWRVAEEGNRGYEYEYEHEHEYDSGGDRDAPLRQPPTAAIRRHLAHRGGRYAPPPPPFGGTSFDCAFSTTSASFIPTKSAINARVFIINKEIAQTRIVFCCKRID